jgi:hypothetical protein
MSDTRNLQDNTELMRLQAKEFKLAGISHLGIEDEWHQSPLFLEFVGTSSVMSKTYWRSPITCDWIYLFFSQTHSQGALAR